VALQIRRFQRAFGPLVDGWRLDAGRGSGDGKRAARTEIRWTQ